mmetsp:Transcript_39659/g.122638  ORF Transcript_39659/g.122638 Transcript_39659/m.122638 type:complete len:218 (+) Transcript_39659:191-844(+)
MFAFTHGAIGAAALDARSITSVLKLFALLARIFLHASRVSFRSVSGLKLRMARTPSFCSHLRIAVHDRSVAPSSVSTPSSTSCTAGGGILSDLSSVRWRFSIWPTASLAASSVGWMPASWPSMTFFFSLMVLVSLSMSFCSTLIFFFCSPASSILAWISTSASSASFCFTSMTPFCSVTSLEILSTFSSASASFCRPRVSFPRISPDALLLTSKMAL